jgi:hypothetical protein
MLSTIIISKQANYFLGVFSLLLLLSTSSYSQQIDVTGDYISTGYNTRDTSIYLYFSNDSVAEIKTVPEKNSPWLSVREGHWTILNIEDGSYKIRIIFNNGDYLQGNFFPLFSSIPQNDTIKPNGYTLVINKMHFTSIFGKHGLYKKSILPNINGIKAGL